MSSIKFSYRFNKMPFDTRTSWLVGVSVADISQLPRAFIDWDTAHPGGHFSLAPAGPHILLTIFTLHEAASFSHTWTTVRTWDAEKEKYYRAMIGRRVDIDAPPAPPSAPELKKPPGEGSLEWFNDASLWCRCPGCGNAYFRMKICSNCGTKLIQGKPQEAAP